MGTDMRVREVGRVWLGVGFVTLVAGGGCDRGSATSDGPIDASIDVGPPVDAGPCDLLTQTGCSFGERCTWIRELPDIYVGAHVGCAPNGSIATTGVCGPPMAGYDDCVKGSVCASGECKSICDPQGGLPTCDANHACARYANFLGEAGVCDPGCDPLTQDLKIGPVRTACASAQAAMPTRGCYGTGAYSCAGVGQVVGSLTRTDRVPPWMNYINGCSPGYIPLLTATTGSTQVLCTGFCAVLETDNTSAHAGNGKGDPTAVAKLPAQALPLAGNGTCDVGKKGSDPSSSCRFLWFHLQDTNGQLPITFANGPYLDTLGVCLATAFFQYDANNDGTPETTYPDCATLPPRSGATPGKFDDAADWGCQKRANSMFTQPVSSFLPDVPTVQWGTFESVAPVRHTFE